MRLKKWMVAGSLGFPETARGELPVILEKFLEFCGHRDLVKYEECVWLVGDVM